jgi:CheY-like chemotaxis protein
MDDERECPEGWDLAQNSYEAIRMLIENEYDVVSLDHDLGIGWPNGMTVLNWLEERHHNGHKIPFILIHTANASVRRIMQQVADKLNQDR